jgi:cGMP-dependent protein kinase
MFQINAGFYLFSEGDPGNFFFIVKEGELELSIPNTDEKKIFKRGDTFGELALIQKNKRSGSVKCTQQAMLFCLEGNIFREMVQKLNRIDLKERIYFLNLIPIFKGLSSVELHNVARGMIKCEYEQNHQILSQGEKGESLFIIKDGVIACVREEKEIRKLYTKDYFGESSILFETKRSLSIIASTKSTVYQISKSVLQETLGDKFKNILLMGIGKEGIHQSKIMKNLLFDDYFLKIFPAFQLTFYKNTQIVVPHNHFEKRKILIVIEGNLINVCIFIFT